MKISIACIAYFVMVLVALLQNQVQGMSPLGQYTVCIRECETMIYLKKNSCWNLITPSCDEAHDSFVDFYLWARCMQESTAVCTDKYHECIQGCKEIHRSNVRKQRTRRIRINGEKN
ncbi:uncharacterized protein LOC135493345 isoform X2 [Lineus longissimus]|uniref:uncharacterized protein LOC135493345 isoform X2 n=1 Tax=Lineus longissimus TaxID=88925 RepID=UPI002B4DC75E